VFIVIPVLTGFYESDSSENKVVSFLKSFGTSLIQSGILLSLIAIVFQFINQCVLIGVYNNCPYVDLMNMDYDSNDFKLKE